MKRVELYGRVRHAVMIEGLSQREAARCFGIDPRTVRKMLSRHFPDGPQIYCDDTLIHRHWNEFPSAAV